MSNEILTSHSTYKNKLCLNLNLKKNSTSTFTINMAVIGKQR